jgi:hypothetical protein
MGYWGYSSTSLDIGSRWRWMISFTPRVLYSRKMNPRYPYRMLVGHRSRFREEKNLMFLPGRNPAVQLITILTELSLLPPDTIALKIICFVVPRLQLFLSVSWISTLYLRAKTGLWLHHVQISRSIKYFWISHRIFITLVVNFMTLKATPLFYFEFPTSLIQTC